MASQLLFHAANQGDLDLCQTLIIEGCADVNFRNTLGESAIHVAAKRGLSSVLELLLGFGGDPNVQQRLDLGGKTPLHVAVEKGHIRVVEVLLSGHADPNITDSMGMLPLHYAARAGNEEVAELLMCHGTRLDVKDHRGKSAAAYARERGCRVIADRLPPVDTQSNRPIVVRKADKALLQRVEVDGVSRWERVSKPEDGVVWIPREEEKKKGGGKKKGGKKKD
eukprot:Hpha_TRINITY_DN26550_c0_g1::TRINITY_DN26550_c0_g1_i1::g.113007::m.113007